MITTKSDGSPQSSDVAFAVIDGEIVISITDERAKTANIRRDPRVVLHITAPDEWSYIAFSGEARLSPVATDPGDATADELVDYYERVAGEPHPDWTAYRSLQKFMTGVGGQTTATAASDRVGVSSQAFLAISSCRRRAEVRRSSRPGWLEIMACRR